MQQLKKQLADVQHQEQTLSHTLFAVDMEMAGVQQRMEQVQALEQLSNAHVTYTSMITLAEDRMPLTPRWGGPVECPVVTDRTETLTHQL